MYAQRAFDEIYIHLSCFFAITHSYTLSDFFMRTHAPFLSPSLSLSLPFSAFLLFTTPIKKCILNTAKSKPLSYAHFPSCSSTINMQLCSGVSPDAKILQEGLNSRSHQVEKYSEDIFTEAAFLYLSCAETKAHSYRGLCSPPLQSCCNSAWLFWA